MAAELTEAPNFTDAFEPVTATDQTVLYIPVENLLPELVDQIAYALRVRARDLAFPYLEAFAAEAYRRPKEDLTDQELAEVHAFFAAIGIAVPVE